MDPLRELLRWLFVQLVWPWLLELEMLPGTGPALLLLALFIGVIALIGLSLKAQTEAGDTEGGEAE